MHRKIRRILFVLFVTGFLIGAPVLVLYTAGYRLNPTTWRIQHTGVIAIATTPKNAEVSVNGIRVSDKTPFVDQRLMPGTYTVTLKKSGYHQWQQNVRVESGQTTYITTLLFRESAPELLLEQRVDDVIGTRDGRYLYLLIHAPDNTASTILKYDTITRIHRTVASVRSDSVAISLNTQENVVLLTMVGGEQEGIHAETGEIITGDALIAAQNIIPEFSFIDNGNNVEMRDAFTNELVTLLPLGTYTPVFRDGSLVVMSDTRDRAYLVNITTRTVTHVDIPTTLLAAHAEQEIFVASDGNEVMLYAPTSGEKTLLLRQAEPIIALAWHPSANAVFVATPSTIIAIDREKIESRIVTPLVTNATIVAMWPDATGKNLTFFGTVGATTGIWNVAIGQ